MSSLIWHFRSSLDSDYVGKIILQKCQVQTKNTSHSTLIYILNTRALYLRMTLSNRLQEWSMAVLIIPSVNTRIDSIIWHRVPTRMCTSWSRHNNLATLLGDNNSLYKLEAKYIFNNNWSSEIWIDSQHILPITKNGKFGWTQRALRNSPHSTYDSNFQYTRFPSGNRHG